MSIFSAQRANSLLKGKLNHSGFLNKYLPQLNQIFQILQIHTKDEVFLKDNGRTTVKSLKKG